MKKLLKGLWAATAAFTLFALAACGGNGGVGGDNGGNTGGNNGGGSGDNGGGDLPIVYPEEKPDDYEYYAVDEAATQYQIKSYIGTDKNVTLPSVSPDGTPVVAIYVNYSANSQTTGEYKPFFDSTVETVHIPASYTSFYNGYNPFYGAKNLKSITVDENNPAFCAEDGVLYDKAKTKVICCPYNKTGVLNLPDTVKEVPLEAMRCYEVSLTTNIFNNTFQTEGTFSSKITGVKLPANVENFEFQGCRELANVDFGASNVTKIGLGAFRQCLALKQITLPASLRYIGSEAFQSAGLESVVVPDAVRAVNNCEDPATESASVSGDIFINCKNLKSVKGPAQLLFGERGAADVGSPKNGCKNNFLGCTALKTITVTASEPGAGGTAWAISDYTDRSWVDDPQSKTFTALEKIEYLGGVYEKTDASKMQAFKTDYPSVSVIGAQ